MNEESFLYLYHVLTNMAHEWICVDGFLIHIHGDREVINVILRKAGREDHNAEQLVERANSREKVSAEIYPE